MAGTLFTLFSYAGLTGAVQSPTTGPVAAPIAAAAGPSLSYDGGKVILTGSVQHLFETIGTFVGPNEAMKTDRVRPDVDVLSLTKSFAEMRTRIAALAASDNKGALPVASGTLIADAVVTATPTPTTTRIARAAVDPSLATAAPPDSQALEAIAGAASESDGPTPGTLSSKLAYARADAPITVFSARPATKYSAKDLNCLAQAVYFEARSESYRGQVAVAQVVMNRLAHPLYPNTICGVVFQNASKRNACQFSFACDGIPEMVNEKKPWAQAEDIAAKVASGELYLPEVGNATHYHATYVYPDWAPRLKKVTKIGLHVFYKFKRA